MANNISTRVLPKPLRPSTDHNIFYYFLDFDHNQWHWADKFGNTTHSGTPCVAMLHLSRCTEYQFYYTHRSEIYHQYGNGEGYTKVYLTVEERMMSRNEFFSQYALGTLEGVFVATRDVKYLREYLTYRQS